MGGGGGGDEIREEEAQSSLGWGAGWGAAATRSRLGAVAEGKDDRAGGPGASAAQRAAQ